MASTTTNSASVAMATSINNLAERKRSHSDQHIRKPVDLSTTMTLERQ